MKTELTKDGQYAMSIETFEILPSNEERIDWVKRDSSFRECVNNAVQNQLLAKDNVNHPSHYTDGKIEVIDYIEDKKLGYHLGNVVKYVSRAGKKCPDKEIEDLKKARWYLDRHIEKLEEANEERVCNGRPSSTPSYDRCAS